MFSFWQNLDDKLSAVMIGYFIRRVLAMVPLLLGIVAVSFFVLQLAPGGPADQIATMETAHADRQAYDRMQEIYGLDQPMHIQFWQWLNRVVRLDFGYSLSLDRRLVSEKIAQALPLTLVLNLLSLAFILVLAIPLGVYGAAKRGSWFDRLFTFFVFIGFSTPSFWLALLCMIVFAVEFGWLPISWTTMPTWGNVSSFTYVFEAFRHGLLPIFCMSFGAIAVFSNYVRASMVDVLSEEYMINARAKGVGQNVLLWRHAFANARLPLITLLGLTLPSLIGGSIVLEQIFAIPGMGRLFWQAVNMRDYTLIMGILTIGAILTLLGNLLADLGYGLSDPRLRQHSK